MKIEGMSLLERATSLGISGWMSAAELDKLAELAKGREVLEIGSFKGLSAWAMGQTAKKVYCIDTFAAADDGQTQTDALTTFEDFKRAVAGLPVTWLIMSSLDASMAVERRFDMLFIDAMHDYESVLFDIETWKPSIREGGIVALHDYRQPVFPGVEKAADEIFGPAPEGTVVETLRWIQL